jgi:hypothetical protein
MSEHHDDTTMAHTLAQVIDRIRRHYPNATCAYVNHPHDGADVTRIALCTIFAGDEVLWPDQEGEAFADSSGRGERLWTDGREGDPYTELAEINEGLTTMHQSCGATMFEPGELTGGWYMTLAR